MTPEQLIAQEMLRRTGTSIFDQSGKLRTEDALNRTKEGRIAIGEYLHLASIPWAPEPDGAEHCQWLSRLVEYMASLPQTWGGVVGTPFDEHNKKVLHAVSMLYCTGKGGDAQGGLLNKGVGPSSLGETGYEARSAKLAEEFFRAGGADGTSWNKPEVREDVCRLIFRHNDAREIESDKRLQVFADSLRYETVRYSPNTEAGMALLKERCRPELFFSGWAKDRANFRQWMLTRGWR